MSNRHIVEKSFNELLESYRSEVLPSIVKGWSDLSQKHGSEQSGVLHLSYYTKRGWKLLQEELIACVRSNSHVNAEVLLAYRKSSYFLCFASSSRLPYVFQCRWKPNQRRWFLKL